MLCNTKSKAELRQRILGERRRDPQKDRIITEKLLALPQLKAAELVLCYAALPKEIDTTAIVHKILETGKKLAMPRVEGELIRFYFVGGWSELREGCFHVMEPGEGAVPVSGHSGLCIVPALACSPEKHRIGYGKGYYDRFLTGFGGVSVALCYREHILDFEADAHDKAVDIVLTD